MDRGFPAWHNGGSLLSLLLNQERSKGGRKLSEVIVSS